MTPKPPCKWCADTGRVNRYNPETKEYQDYDCGFCAEEHAQIRAAAVKAIADLFPDRKEAAEWEI